jgi:hypothetical protein
MARRRRPPVDQETTPRTEAAAGAVVARFRLPFALDDLGSIREYLALPPALEDRDRAVRAVEQLLVTTRLVEYEAMRTLLALAQAARGMTPDERERLDGAIERLTRTWTEER